MIEGHPEYKEESLFFPSDLAKLFDLGLWKTFDAFLAFVLQGHYHISTNITGDVGFADMFTATRGENAGVEYGVKMVSMVNRYDDGNDDERELHENGEVRHERFNFVWNEIDRAEAPLAAG